ncbi:MAG: hypothetical protein WD904_02945 [Dehalococcoidia bacterium]
MRLLVSLAFALALATVACGDDDEEIARESPSPTTSASPEPTGAEEITWDEALELFEACEVSSAMQAHSLDIWLTLDDGREVHTKEPGIDDLFTVVDGLPEGCAPSSMATE